MRLKAPKGTATVATAGGQFAVDPRGVVEVPAEAAAHLMDCGFILAPPPMPSDKPEELPTKRQYSKKG